ncbi:MAG: hypothetical protein K6C05_01340 [Anaerovibrio sp.]|uniref:hypothetical protein n=1 Tax=Anaerovibrio sp. TaxID=1872532 RepID=UPI0025DEA26B|nr:hypothetical protein [Anaerovibrio sp.]MCR5175473.1 hypothetical protein [Anaerovibrio sp.]
MVHTFDIGMLFWGRTEALELMKMLRFSKRSINRFDIKGYAEIDGISAVHKGIKEVTMTKCMEKIAGKKKNQGNCIGYSLRIQIEPWLLITRQPSIELFECTEDNISRLIDVFRDFMAPYVQDTEYAYLADLLKWNCRRIDYTHNIHFKDKRDADTFYRLSKRTSLHQRTKVKRRKDEAMFAQSTAEGNLSNKAVFYDKRAQIEEDYAGMNEDDLDDLMEAAENVIRYEIQCYKGKVSTIKRKYGLPDRSIVRFLDEDIANELLFKRYETSIGYGDFYELSRAKSRIMHYDGTLSNNQPITDLMRKRLIQFMQMVAQVRGLDAARQCFQEGCIIKNSKPQILVKGSDNTFLTRIKDLLAMGINPVPIPRPGKKKNAAGEVTKTYDYPRELENPIHSW